MMRTPDAATIAVRWAGQSRMAPAEHGMAGFLHAFPLDERLVLLDERAGELSLLNPSATRIWHARQAGLEAAEIAQALSAASGEPGEAVRAQVEEMLLAWESIGRAPARGTADHRASEALSDSTRASSIRFLERRYAIGRARFTVRYATPFLEQRVHPILAHLEDTATLPADHVVEVIEEDDDCVVVCDGHEVDRDHDPDIAKALVLSQLAVRAHPGGDLRAVLHSAAVTEGRHCLLLPGAPGAGKSTLAAALMFSGLTCLGDDCIVLGGQAMKAFPFPVGLSLKEPSWSSLTPFWPGLEAAPAYRHGKGNVRYVPPTPTWRSVSAAGLPVSGMVFPEFQAGTATSLQALPPSQTFARLFAARSWLRPPLTRGSVEDFVSWVRSAPSSALTYSDLSEAVAVVRELVQR